MVRSWFLICGAWMLSVIPSRAQEFTLQALEKEFLQHNYLLLAARYDVDVKDAQILQEKLWNNPSLTVAQINFWANSSSEQLPYLWGNYGNTQQISVDLEQLIETAGKRKKRVALKQYEKEDVRLDFEQLMRELKWELRNTYIDLQVAQLREQQLVQIVTFFNKLRDSYQKQSDKQLIAKADFLRIQSELMRLKEELIRVRDEKLKLLQELRMFTRNSTIEKVLPLPADALSSLSQKIPADIVDLAMDNNISRQKQELSYTMAEQSLRLEKANAKPDIRLQLNYDRGGNIMHDFVGVGINMDLPVFNRNQGNIRAARYEVLKQSVLKDDRAAAIRHTIDRLIQQLRLYESELQTAEITSAEAYQQMMDNYFRHLQTRQISLIEFLDFSQAFMQAQESIWNLQSSYLRVFEELQYTIGRDI